MSNGYPFSLLNDEQMNNKVWVENQPVIYNREITGVFSQHPRLGELVKLPLESVGFPLEFTISPEDFACRSPNVE